MAKFAIALCVLFVACNALAYSEISRPGDGRRNIRTKTENEEADELLEEINSDSHWISDEADKRVEEIKETSNKAIESASTVRNNINSDIQNRVNEHNEIINGIISAAADVVQCAASSINITQIATDIVLNSMVCVNGKLNVLLTKRNNIISAYDNLKKSVRTLQTNANNCEWGLWSRLTCVRDYLRQLNGVVLPNTYRLIQTTTEYTLEVYNSFNTLWRDCYENEIQETFSDAASKIVAEVTECISNWNTNSARSEVSTV